MAEPASSQPMDRVSIGAEWLRTARWLEAARAWQQEASDVDRDAESGYPTAEAALPRVLPIVRRTPEAWSHPAPADRAAAFHDQSLSSPAMTRTRQHRANVSWRRVI